jgi:polyisoprenoid-binding protein YceI
MKTSFILNTVAALALTSSIASAAIYKLDTAHSNVGFKVKHMMISNVNGKFTDFEGTFDVTDGKFISLDSVIQATSINTDNKDRDKHLRSADFFDVAKYPTITFRLTKQEGDKVYGELSMKGITKSIVLTSEVGGEVKDPWGNIRSAFVLEGKINRKDFGLTWNKALETGGVLVDDTIKIIVEAQGIRQ